MATKDDQQLLDELDVPGQQKQIDDQFAEERRQARLDKALKMGIEGVGNIAAGYMTGKELKDNPGYVAGIKAPSVSEWGESQSDVLDRYKARNQQLQSKVSDKRQSDRDKLQAEQVGIDRARQAKMDDKDAKRLLLEERRVAMAETKQSQQERQQARDAIQQQQMADLQADAQDPRSGLSAQARSTLTDITGKQYPASMTAAQIKQIFNQEVAKAGKAPQGPQTEEEIVSRMSGEQKKRYDNSRMGLDAINDMTKAWNEGENTFTLVGDNNFTKGKSLFVEALGRMQSGGAITDDEVKNFKRLLPTVYDDEEMQISKLQDLKREMQSRLSTSLGKATKPKADVKVRGSDSGLSEQEQAELEALEAELGDQ